MKSTRVRLFSSIVVISESISRLLSQTLLSKLAHTRRSNERYRVIVRSPVADSCIPHILPEELLLPRSSMRNRGPPSALDNGTLFKTLHRKEAYLEHLQMIEARALRHVETHTKKVDDRAWEERLVAYIVDGESFRMNNSDERGCVKAASFSSGHRPSCLNRTR